MIITFFDNIRDFITKLFGKFNFSSLFTLITGIILGFIIFAITYLIILASTFEKKEKKVDNINVDDEIIMGIINSSKIRYKDESQTLTTSEKTQLVKKIGLDVINDIAKVYYPDSKYPLYELSIDELITLCHYITDRIDDLLSGPVIGKFRKIRISQLFEIYDLKKKYDNNKMIKAAKKSKVSKAFSSVMGVVNFFNPAYWVKKLMINATTVLAVNKFALIIIGIVGEETNKVYSKSVFQKENPELKELDKDIEDVKKLVENSEVEENE